MGKPITQSPEVDSHGKHGRHGLSPHPGNWVIPRHPTRIGALTSFNRLFQTVSLLYLSPNLTYPAPGRDFVVAVKYLQSTNGDDS